MFGAILGAGAILGGGLLSSSASRKATSSSAAIAREQMELQKEFAKNSIQWKVADAQKAGLHPLAALGTSSASYSPVSANIEPIDYSWLGDVGQNINRAIQQGKDAKERKETQDLENKFNFVNLRKANAEADYWEAQAANERFALQQQLFPPTPPVNSADGLISGVSSNRLVSPEPMRTTPHTEPGKEPGSNPSTGWIQNPDGSVTAVQSESAKERLEEDMIGSSIWALNNRVFPHAKTMFGLPAGASAPPNDLLPKGAVRWMYNGYGSFVPVDSHGKRVGGPPQENSDEALRKYVRGFPKRHFGRFGVKY